MIILDTILTNNIFVNFAIVSFIVVVIFQTKHDDKESDK